MATSPSSLTFAAAMALDPSDVEVSFSGALWRPLRDQEGAHELRAFRIAHFRRARPRRSRVQEMAEQREGAPDVHARERAEHYAEAIRAVCEYAKKVGPLVATDIEREFLVER